jgi:hypothetical protein
VTGPRAVNRSCPAVHPSSLLRAPDDETLHTETVRFFEEMKQVASVIRLATAPQAA